MRILGIDYGRAKVGLAIGEGSLAEPWKVVKPSEVKKILEEENFEKIIVGVSEGEMAKESKEFAKKLGAETFDETLSSQDAQRLSIESGMNRKKRKNMEDAFAASVMLQNYLDSKHIN
ncbi:MAG TPA: RuvX/YqgF family protein [Alphaproteobacteria bacterium]|jgi:putative Holliday junction resolvase|nr:RuvX/YqgF family protein [Alphaproteobacteria bacterium]